MKEIINISETILAELRATNRRMKGSIGFESTSEGLALTFRAYSKGGATPRNPQTLLVLPHGKLSKTARRYKLDLSLSDALGEQRIGEELERDSQEARQFLKHMSDILQIV